MAYENDTTVAIKKLGQEIQNPEAALDWVLEATGFFAHVKKAMCESAKPVTEFMVAIKANIMMTISHRSRLSAASTSPKLVAALTNRLIQCGYHNIVVVEAENTLSNWYMNRDVRTVASYGGYATDGSLGYRMVDLTNDPDEVQAHDFGGDLGQDTVGKTWRDADFRVSFAKFKTTPFGYGSFSLKNTFGCFPTVDKLNHYHGTKTGFYRATANAMASIPIHFALIDGIQSSSGIYGLFGGGVTTSNVILGGRNPIALDMEAMKLMGVAPLKNQLIQIALQKIVEPQHGILRYGIEGDSTPFRSWRNVPKFIPPLLGILEPYSPITYCILRTASIFVDRKAFPLKRSISLA